MSEAMILAVKLKNPFADKKMNNIEMINETIVIVCMYHVILLSDMVPVEEKDFRDCVGFSLVLFITLVALFLIVQMLYPAGARIS